MGIVLQIHAENPEKRHISLACDILKKGGIMVYPTDSVYAMACSMEHIKSAEKIAKIKGTKLKEAQFSILCESISQISEYTVQFNRTTFKILQKHLPGPFTFILEANKKLAQGIGYKRKQIGTRVSNHPISQSIVEALGHPIITTSIHDDDEILNYTTDPELLEGRYINQVELIIDGGLGNREASTVVDLSTPEPTIMREGIGIFKP